jgi:hypothetical protein
MMIFDASNRDECEVKRSRTNTPLQALVMMNDPVVLEASLALADRLLKDKSTPEGTITTGFRRIVCRSPAKKETEILLNYWKGQLDHFKANPGLAEKLVKAGEYKLNKEASPIDVAALMQVLQIIYNMEETITKT